jgi:hypothetical protein
MMRKLDERLVSSNIPRRSSKPCKRCQSVTSAVSADDRRRGKPGYSRPANEPAGGPTAEQLVPPGPAIRTFWQAACIAELVGEFDLAGRCHCPVRRKSRPLRTLLSQRASLFVVQYRGDIQI